MKRYSIFYPDADPGARCVFRRQWNARRRIRHVVISQIANRNNCRITFMSFTKYGFPFMLASLAVAHLYLYVKFFM